MESKKNINRLVEETLDSVSGIETVKAPPFFKESVLKRMHQKPVEKDDVFVLNWFTPKYQAAALICFVFLNTAALLTYSSESYTDDVSSFAEIYGLSETDSDTYLYQN